MSFLTVYGKNNVTITGNPEITLFAERPFDLGECLSHISLERKVEAINNNNINLNKCLESGILFRHTNFDRNSVVFESKEFDKNEHVYNLKLNDPLKNYHYLTSLIISFTNNLPRQNLEYNLKSITFELGGVKFSFTTQQLLAYHSFYGDILYVSDGQYCIKLPISLLDGNKTLPITKYLDMSIFVETITEMPFELEAFVIEADSEEVRKHAAYYRDQAEFYRVIDYQEQFDYDIRGDIEIKTSNLNCINYPIKELIWFYNNKCGAESVTLKANDFEKKLTKKQCTITSQLCNHGKTNKNFYTYCFATQPTLTHPTGEFIRNDYDFNMVHHCTDILSCYDIKVGIIALGFQLLHFVRDDTSGKLLCKFEEFSKLDGRNKVDIF